jgi:hypothetical protein
MIPAIAETTMPRKKKSTTGEPPTKAVKIDRALATKAQMIATDKGMSLADYISESLRGAVEKDWSKMVKRIGESSS